MVTWPLLQSPSDFWDRSRETYIENWPDSLRLLSVPQYGMGLTPGQARVLGSNIAELGELFADKPMEGLVDIILHLDSMMALYFPNGAFVRLGSRSPKDSWLGLRRGFKVKSGREAVELLTDTSERVLEPFPVKGRLGIFAVEVPW